MQRERSGTGRKRATLGHTRCFIGMAAACVACIVGCESQVVDVLIPDNPLARFRDDFNGQLEPGWTIDGEQATQHSLTDRPGFLRIFPQEISIDSTVSEAGLLVRELEGDFVVVTRMQFETVLDLQLAGIVVQGPDLKRLVSFGLIQASGARGTFRGLLLRADRGPDVASGRATAPYDSDEVYLRLERSGNTYTASYSRDGITFETVGSVTNDLPGSVLVGLGAIKGDSCGQDCDRLLPADFDFFEVL